MAEHNPDEYKNVKFYAKHSKPKQAGFSKFKLDKEYYFCRYIDGDIAMLSQAYTSEAGRDNGIESVKKNETQTKRYRFLSHGPNAHGFSLKAGNGQEIAISPNYTNQARAEHVTGRLTGKAKAKTATPKKAAKVAPKKAAPKKSVSKPRAANTEQNYMPLAFYKKATKGKKTGFESFKGDDGEHYFTYFENNKIALISEGYPTATVRDKGLASVKKNMKTESRYVFGKWDDGKEGFALRAGNNKEIARSVGYGSAATAAAGAAYIMGTRRRVSPKKAKPAATALAVASVAAKPKSVKKPAAAKPKPKANKKKVKRSVAPLAAGSVAVAGLGASAAAAKASAVKKAAVPVKAPVKPKPKPKTVKKKVKRSVAPLAAGSVAVAGLGASAAAAKTSAVKKAAVPVKAASIKAAPIAAAALGTAAVAGAAAMAAKPKVKPVVAAPVTAAVSTPAAAPVVAAAPVAAAIPAAASVGGGGIWGWLKWLLMALILLLAAMFLFKSCVGGEKAVKTVAPVTTTKTVAPAAMVTCWNGSKAKNDQACPTKITCWDDSFATRQSACPVQPVANDFNCWDGSKAVDLASCPTKPVAKLTTAAITPSSVAGRVCAPSSKALFNVSSSTPKSVSVLGTNPQFGNSLTLTPNEFYQKLATAHRTYANDRAFLDLLAQSLGYGSFGDMDASMFSNDTLSQGTSGLLGFGSQHSLQFSALDVTDSTHLEAFKVRSANGTDVHFMKRCGNFMYVCQP